MPTTASRSTKKESPKATPAKAVQAELAKVKSELSVNRALAENSPVNILMADENLNITYANPASVKTLKTLEKYLPVRAEEIVGKSIDIFHKNPEMQRRLLSSDRNLPHRAVISIGPEKADLLVSPVYDSTGKYLGPMVTWEVITEKLRLDRWIRRTPNRSSRRLMRRLSLDLVMWVARSAALKPSRLPSR